MVSRTDAKDWAKEKLGPLWGIHWIPWTPDDRLDEPELRRHLSTVLELTMDGLGVAPVSAEIFALTAAERMRISEIALEENSGRLSTYLAATTDGTAGTLELVRHAQQVGHDFAMVHAPYEFARTEDDVFRFFEYIDQNSDIAIQAYSSMHSGSLMSPRLIARIAELPSVCSIKYNAARYEDVIEAIALAGDRIVVSYPFESRWLDTLGTGYRSLIQATVVPFFQAGDFTPVKDYTDLAIAGRLEEARVIRDALQPLRDIWSEMNAIIQKEGRHPCAAAKYWAHVMGLIDTPAVRRPEPQVTPALAEKIGRAPRLLEEIRVKLSQRAEPVQ